MKPGAALSACSETEPTIICARSCWGNPASNRDFGYFSFPGPQPLRSGQCVTTGTACNARSPVPQLFSLTSQQTNWWTLGARESVHTAPACTNGVNDELPASGNPWPTSVDSA